MTNDVKKISVDLIDDPVIAMRTDIDESYIEELGRSIKEHGLINPISVKPVGSRFEVIAGHQRLLASRRVGIIFLDCIVRDISADESLILTAHENMVRQDVNPVDEAVFLGRLVTEKEYTPDVIGKMLRRTTDWVEQRLNMLNFPDYVLSAIGSKLISMSAAESLMKITDEAYRKNLFEIGVKDGVSALNADRWFQMWKMNILPTAPTVENMAVATSQFAPPETAIQCAKCREAGLVKEMLTVWIHKECPPES